jgi:Pentapeptide repeats (8 copies)
MANDEHVALLKQGVAAWNAWRRENPNIRPDLRGVNLEGADLNGADLNGAHLYKANLNRADLHGANLRGAWLGWADLGGAADLRNADLSWAILIEANLSEAVLSEAKLSKADLGGMSANAAVLSLSVVIGSESPVLSPRGVERVDLQTDRDAVSEHERRPKAAPRRSAPRAQTAAGRGERAW